MKFIFTLLCFSMISTAFGSDISCTRDDEGDDWVISGTLGGGMISLFDNDTTSEFRLKGVLERLPPIYVYEEVKDSDNVIRVMPSRDRRSATAVYFSNSAPNDKLYFTCDVQ